MPVLSKFSIDNTAYDLKDTSAHNKADAVTEAEEYAALFMMIFLLTLVALRFCLDEPWGNIAYCGFFSYNQQHISFQFYSLLCIPLGLDANNNIYGDQVGSTSDGLQVLVFIVLISVKQVFMSDFVPNIVADHMASDKAFRESVKVPRRDFLRTGFVPGGEMW